MKHKFVKILQIFRPHVMQNVKVTKQPVAFVAFEGATMRVLFLNEQTLRPFVKVGEEFFQLCKQFVHNAQLDMKGRRRDDG